MPNALTVQMRQKYPGAYDDLTDDQLTAKVLEKYPQYKDLAGQSSESASKTQPGEAKVDPLAFDWHDGPPIPGTPAFSKIVLRTLLDHPALATGAGAIGGMTLGAAGGPLGMAAGGALGASGANAYSQLARQAISPENAPQTSTDAAKEIGLAGAGGAASGLIGGVGPLRAGLLATGVGLVSGQSPQHAAIEGALTAAGIKGGGVLARGAGKLINEAVGPILDRALQARLGHAIAREAPEAVSAVEQAVRAAPTVAAATQGAAKDVPIADMLKWSNSNLNGREIVNLIKGTHGLTEAEAERQLVRFNSEILPQIRAASKAAAPAPVAPEPAPVAPAPVAAAEAAPPVSASPPVVPEPAAAPPTYPRLVPEPVKATVMLPDGQRMMPTNYGGNAKPGPLPPTPPGEVEAALRASIGNPEVRPRPDKILTGPPGPNAVTRADNALGDVLKWKREGVPDMKIVGLLKTQHGINPPQGELALSRINEKLPSILEDERSIGGGTPPGDVAATLQRSIDAVKASKGKVSAQGALADELVSKVIDWKSMGYSKGQMVNSMRELYKIDKGAGAKMVDMVFKAYGVN